MTHDDFKNLKGRKPEQQPYKRPKVPKKLKKVKPHQNHKVKFTFSDYIRIIWMYILGEAEKKLNPQEKLIGDKIICYAGIGLLALAIIVFAVVRFWG